MSKMPQMPQMPQNKPSSIENIYTDLCGDNINSVLHTIRMEAIYRRVWYLTGKERAALNLHVLMRADTTTFTARVYMDDEDHCKEKIKIYNSRRNKEIEFEVEYMNTSAMEIMDIVEDDLNEQLLLSCRVVSKRLAICLVQPKYSEMSLSKYLKLPILPSPPLKE